MSLSKAQNGQLPTLRYTKESTNFSRLFFLVVSAGTLALKTQFNKICSPGMLCHVLGYETVFNDLQTLKEKRIITPKQWSTLFPAVREFVSSDKFDISLLVVLLRNICGLPPPSTGWDNLPQTGDATVSADIARIRYFRSEVIAHILEAVIDDETFEKYWKILLEAIVRLLGESYRPQLDALKEGDPRMADHYESRLRREIEEENAQQTGDDNCAANIAEALLSNKSLTTYGCPGRNVDDSDVERFAEVLVKNETLMRLDLSNNLIGNHGACLIARALKENDTLKTLNLSNNRIGDKGAIAVANALRVNETLEELCMNNNEYGSDAMKYFSEVVKTSTTIKKLVI